MHDNSCKAIPSLLKALHNVYLNLDLFVKESAAGQAFSSAFYELTDASQGLVNFMEDSKDLIQKKTILESATGMKNGILMI